MFDLVAGSAERPLRERAPGSTAVSVILHVIVLTLAVGVPLMRVTNTLPDVPSAIMAFVAAPPTVVAPPPPPPASGPPKAAPRQPATPTPSNPAVTAPVVTPTEIAPEAPRTTTAIPGAPVGGAEGGVVGGIEGGVTGGVEGGVAGGLVSNVPPPPPPPPPPTAPAGPVRVGGLVHAPALVHRVEPVYPDVAAMASIGGTVILEAVVGTDGCVESVSVLRSRHPLLDKAAVEALKQWRYTPLLLNDHPTSFVLTVTFTFSTR